MFRTNFGYKSRFYVSHDKTPYGNKLNFSFVSDNEQIVEKILFHFLWLKEHWNVCLWLVKTSVRGMVVTLLKRVFTQCQTRKEIDDRWKIFVFSASRNAWTRPIHSRIEKKSFSSPGFFPLLFLSLFSFDSILIEPFFKLSSVVLST